MLHVQNTPSVKVSRTLYAKTISPAAGSATLTFSALPELIGGFKPVAFTVEYVEHNTDNFISSFIVYPNHFVNSVSSEFTVYSRNYDLIRVLKSLDLQPLDPDYINNGIILSGSVFPFDLTAVVVVPANCDAKLYIFSLDSNVQPETPIETTSSGATGTIDVNLKSIAGGFVQNPLKVNLTSVNGVSVSSPLPVELSSAVQIASNCENPVVVKECDLSSTGTPGAGGEIVIDYFHKH